MYCWSLWRTLQAAVFHAMLCNYGGMERNKKQNDFGVIQVLKTVLVVDKRRSRTHCYGCKDMQDFGFQHLCRIRRERILVCSVPPFDQRYVVAELGSSCHSLCYRGVGTVHHQNACMASETARQPVASTRCHLEGCEACWWCSYSSWPYYCPNCMATFY